MESAFEAASGVEAEALAHLLPVAEKHGVRIFLFRQQPFLQKFCGDMVANTNGRWQCVELKAEQSDKHGNLFIETWSNLSKLNPGWHRTCHAEKLWYYFVDQRRLHTMLMQELREWVDEHGDDYPERRQNKYTQLNDTWGYCIPISILSRELKSFKTHDIEEIA